MRLEEAVDLRWTDTSTGAGRSLHQVDLDTAVCTDPSNLVFPTPGLATVTPDQVSRGDTVPRAGSDFDVVSDVAFGVVSSPNTAVSDASRIDAVVSNGLAGAVDVVVPNRTGNAEFSRHPGDHHVTPTRGLRVGQLCERGGQTLTGRVRLRPARLCQVKPQRRPTESRCVSDKRQAHDERGRT